MTKKAKIAELETKLRYAEREIAGYKAKIDEYEAAQDAIPEHCTPGKWCEACVFGGSIKIIEYDYSPHSMLASPRVVNLRICELGKCKNFVQREVPDADKSDS